MQFKSFMEALKGKQHKIDKNKNGEIDAHDFKLLRKEESELTEATVKTDKYSWGTMKTVHHGADFSIPLHPEHHQEIAKLKDNQEHKFKDETGRHWTAKRMGDDVHFQGANGGSSTKVKHADLKESEERMARSDYKVGPSGRKSHKEIVFNSGSDETKEDDKKDMKEAKMSDADMAERERIVKGMKKNLSGFKARYGDRAKEVMYATATKQAMKEETLDEALDPSEIAGNPKMYDAATVKKAYYHKSTSASDKESLARHLDRHHGNKEWRKPVKEEAEQIDELSKGTLASYAKKATTDAVIKRKIAGDFETMSDRSRKPGMKQAADANAQKYKEQSWKRRHGVEKAIDRLAKEDMQEQFKVGDFVKDHTGKIHRVFGVNGTNLETGIHYGKDKYGGTNNLHVSKAKKVPRPQDVKEELELDEAFINGREYASHGLMHPDHAARDYHKVTGQHIDFYAHGTGDKVEGKVTKNDGKEVHIKDTKGTTHKFKVQRGLPKQQNEEVELDEAMSPQQKNDFDRMMAGAMSRASYNAKWKKPLKSDAKVIYGKNVKEDIELEEAKKEDVPFDGPYTKAKPETKDKSGAVHTPMSRAKHLARMAMKKQMKEDIDRLFEAKDDSEYNYEGEMAVTQLKTICRHAEALEAKMKPDTNLPEWVQSKITLATDYLQTAHDYLMSELDEQAPVAPVPGDKWKSHAVMVHKQSKQRVVVPRKNVKNYPEHEGWKEVAPGMKLKEDDEVQFSYSEFAMMLEYETKDGVYRHKGTYGGNYVDPEGADDADDKKPKQQPAEKRGRGRPAGAKSGARKITGTSKLFK